ncbi:iron chelate uptake ABC transporter family permease subunit [Martelella radicis]|uniref:Iron complex transport system permease protein n=1 Tax=Martelella radicis TaxID=1397476 RepID=A0A7W6KN06_9HYPH|nr:iron complex transport system permease protein [Martelella radicis]
MIRTLLLLLLTLLIAVTASLHLGVHIYGPATVWQALFGGADGSSEIIIRTLRLPRTLNAILTGAALSLSGLFMQAVTRNPLAEPGLLGVNAGAAFAVACGLVLLGVVSIAGIGLLAIAGALAAAALVFGLSGALGPAAGPTGILLVGVTVTAMLASLTQLFLLIDETALETLLFWLSGGFADRPLALLWIGLGALFIAFIGAAALATSIDALQLDDQSASGIGVDVARTRLSALTLSALLSAGAVAMSGPVAFLGLIAPHITRRLMPMRPGFLALALLAMLTGAIIAVLADILARLIVAPGEAPIGAVLAFVGVPFLIHLLRAKRMRGVNV